MWMDYDEALGRAMANGMDEATARATLETCLASAASGKTYDDKPRTMWADAKRRRVRVVMLWYREPGGWEYCEFTKAGELVHLEAPYVDQDGDSYCPWIIESANVDRDNNRYGEMRHLIDPQDEVNKRRSKALHQSVSRGVIAEEGAVKDVNAARRELARPDFWLEVQQGGFGKVEVVDGLQLAAGQAQLLSDAMGYIMQAGPNAALLGKGTQDQSGRAIEAQQAGGLIEQSDLMDTLRRLDWRVFNTIAAMMKQFWDREMWIRVTDDDDAPRWVGLNEPMWQDPVTGETKPESEWRELIQKAPPGVQVPQLQPAVDPQTGEPLLNNHVARLDMDILVSDAPDTITLDGENYKALLDIIGTLIAHGVPLAIVKLAIEMHPGLPSRRKKQLADMLDQAMEPPQGAQDVEHLKREAAEADIAATRAQAYASLAAGEASLAKAGHGVPYTPPVPDVAEGFGAPQPMGPQGTPAPGPQLALPPPGAGPQPAPQGPPPVQPGPAAAGGPVGMMSRGLAA
jgi:hypothetical protein